MKNSIVKLSIKSMILMLCIVILFGIVSPVVNFADEQKATVVVKYQDKEGNVIADEKIIEGNVGEEYEVARKNIDGYKAYGVTPKDAKGTFTEESIEVVFVYQKIKSEEVVVKYINKEGYYIRRDKTISGYAGDTYETIAENVDGYKVVKTTGKEKGEIEQEGKEIVYTYKVYDRKDKTQWTTAKTLTVIAIIVAVLIVVFIVIAKLEKKNKVTDNEDNSNNK